MMRTPRARRARAIMPRVLHLDAAPTDAWVDALATSLARPADHLLVLVLAPLSEDALEAVEASLDAVRDRIDARLRSVVVVPRRRESASPVRGTPRAEGWRPRVCHVALREAIDLVLRDDLDSAVIGVDLEARAASDRHAPPTIATLGARARAAG